MDFKKQQDIFDGVKWFDSIQIGEDQCGTYPFCLDCRKDEPNPCARAQHRFNHGYIRIAIIHRHA